MADPRAPAEFCAQGHALTPDNIMRVGNDPKNRNGRCRICRLRISSESHKRRRREKKAEASA